MKRVILVALLLFLAPGPAAAINCTYLTGGDHSSITSYTGTFVEGGCPGGADDFILDSTLTVTFSNDFTSLDPGGGFDMSAGTLTVDVDNHPTDDAIKVQLDDGPGSTMLRITGGTLNLFGAYRTFRTATPGIASTLDLENWLPSGDFVPCPDLKADGTWEMNCGGGSTCGATGTEPCQERAAWVYQGARWDQADGLGAPHELFIAEGILAITDPAGVLADAEDILFLFDRNVTDDKVASYDVNAHYKITDVFCDGATPGAPNCAIIFSTQQGAEDYADWTQADRMNRESTLAADVNFRDDTIEITDATSPITANNDRQGQCLYFQRGDSAGCDGLNGDPCFVGNPWRIAETIEGAGADPDLVTIADIRGLPYTIDSAGAQNKVWFSPVCHAAGGNAGVLVPVIMSGVGEIAERSVDNFIHEVELEGGTVNLRGVSFDTLTKVIWGDATTSIERVLAFDMASPWEVPAGTTASHTWNVVQMAGGDGSSSTPSTDACLVTAAAGGPSGTYTINDGVFRGCAAKGVHCPSDAAGAKCVGKRVRVEYGGAIQSDEAWHVATGTLGDVTDMSVIAHIGTTLNTQSLSDQVGANILSIGGGEISGTVTNYTAIEPRFQLFLGAGTNRSANFTGFFVRGGSVSTSSGCGTYRNGMITDVETTASSFMTCSQTAAKHILSLTNTGFWNIVKPSGIGVDMIEAVGAGGLGFAMDQVFVGWPRDTINLFQNLFDPYADNFALNHFKKILVVGFQAEPAPDFPGNVFTTFNVAPDANPFGTAEDICVNLGLGGNTYTTTDNVTIAARLDDFERAPRTIRDVLPALLVPDRGDGVTSSTPGSGIECGLSRTILAGPTGAYWALAINGLIAEAGNMTAALGGGGGGAAQENF